VAATAALLALAGCSAQGASDNSPVANVSIHDSDNLNGSVLPKPYTVPSVGLEGSDGKPYDLATAATKPLTLVFFGYTHCPDICNVVLANFASALRGATPAVRKDVRMLFVTTDPARDTPDVVRDYLDRFDPTYEGLVAPVSTVEKAAQALYISYEKPDGSQGGNYMVSHGTYTTAFLHGAARVVWSADTPVADLRADLTRLTRLA